MKDERGRDPEIEKFYTTYRWRKCREAYAKSVDFLCEQCSAEGRITPGEEVHHKKHITRATLNDARITLSPDNLILLCGECHRKAHGKLEKRWTITGDGKVEL